MTQQEIESVSRHYGYDITSETPRQQKVLHIMYRFENGWITIQEVDKQLEKIFKSK